MVYIMQKKLSLILVFSLLLLCNIFAQAMQEDMASSNSIDDNLTPSLQIAMSTPDYLVTPGDIYDISYAAGSTGVKYTAVVDSNYCVRIANLGIIDARGKSFISFKKMAEDLVSKNYPMSGVQVILVNPSTFRVRVEGEVNSVQEYDVWSLTRLSSLIKKSATSYASQRFVQIKSANGKVKQYDLYKAIRDGDMSQNPYLRPGDVIILQRYSRRVSISGAVERPGTYELSDGEGLEELMAKYAGGLDTYADLDRITITRTVNGSSPSGNVIYLSRDELVTNYSLNNHDKVVIGNKLDLMPYIILEGIIVNPEAQKNTDTEAIEDEKASYKEIIRFNQNENYASLIRRIERKFTNYSDLKHSYILRNGNKLSIDIEQILVDRDYMSSYVAEKDDKLMIPYTQKFSNIISVTGEVKSVKEINAWPLRRVSSIIEDHKTDFASSRFVSIIDVDGNIKEYDLFKAHRFGDFSNDPYVQAGETIVLKRFIKKVSVTGAVERPGTYELKDDENLNDLIEYYGGGFTPFADPSRVEITRHNLNDKNNGTKLYYDIEKNSSLIEVQNYDDIVISSLDSINTVLFFEGAVRISENIDEDVQNSNKVTLSYLENENYAYFIRKHKNLFSSYSDTDNSYIIRQGKTIPLDITSMLYDVNYISEYTIEPYDKVIVPFKQYFVSVAGSVVSPGRYPYIPDRTYEYYIGLAGGFIRTQNTGEAVTIKNVNGKKLKKNEFITPETTITAETNSFTYYVNQYSTVVSIVATLTSIIATIISMNIAK